MAYSDKSAMLTGAQAAKQVGVSRQLVRDWRIRGLLKPADHDDQGHPLYRLGDVLRVERRTRNSGCSSRAAPVQRAA